MSEELKKDIIDPPVVPTTGDADPRNGDESADKDGNVSDPDVSMESDHSERGGSAEDISSSESIREEDKTGSGPKDQKKKRAAESDPEDGSPQPKKRQKRHKKPSKPPQETDDTLPGIGIKTRGFFKIPLHNSRVRYLKLPLQRPFGTTRLKLETLGRIAHPAEEDPQFTRLQFKDMQTAEGKYHMRRLVRKQKMVVVSGYHDEYDVCSWDEIAKLGASNEVVTVEYPFQSNNEKMFTNKATLREVYELGAEGSAEYGSTSLPIKPRAPLLEFIADDYISWTSGPPLTRPKYSRPESFAAFNWHLIMQRDTYTGLKQDITGRIMTTFQRCGHRVFFYCRPVESWTNQGQDHADAIFRMEDFERMGTWYVLFIRPGEIFIQPPGPVHVIFTPENNIVRTSQYVTYWDIPQYEKWIKEQALSDTWTPSFNGMHFLRTIHRMANALHASRGDLDLSQGYYVPLAKMVLRPADYLARPTTDEERKIQEEFLSYFTDPAKAPYMSADIKLDRGLLQEEIQDYTAARQLVRERLRELGIDERDFKPVLQRTGR